MEVGCSSRFCLQHRDRVGVAPPFRRIGSSTTISVSTRTKRKLSCFSVSYHKFVDFALNETRRHTHLLPSPLQVIFSIISTFCNAWLLFIPFFFTHFEVCCSVLVFKFLLLMIELHLWPLASSSITKPLILIVHLFLAIELFIFLFYLYGIPSIVFI